MPSGTVRPDPAVDPAGGSRKESSPIAPERTPRPGGTSLPGISRSALVKAGSPSADQFSPADASAPGDGEPSREEVQQRVANLYDRVENATGNFNATRAMAKVTRDTVRPAPSTASDPVSGGRSGGATASAPSADVAKPWFDVGRARLGPVFPAVLPPDRMPGPGPAGPGPAGAGGRQGGRGREAADKPVLELTAGPDAGGSSGPVAELTARPVAELAAGPSVAALPAVPTQRQASDRAVSGPAAGPSQASLKTLKQRNQRKLGQARDLLAGHVARRSTSVAAVESRAVTTTWRPAEEQATSWTGADSWQQPSTGAGTGPYAGGPAYAAGGAPYAAADLDAATDARTGPDVRPEPDLYAGTGAFLLAGTGTYPLPEMRVAADPALGTGMYLGADQYAGTGLYIDASTPIAAGVAQDMQGRPDPGYAGKGARAVEFARAQIGKPCVWGAMGPGSYDCSSLTQAAWRAAGVALPRSVHEQATAGTAVPVSDLRPGDLVLFNGPVGHVGIHTGDGMMVHAPSPGAAIREESVYWAGEAAIHSVIRPS